MELLTIQYLRGCAALMVVFHHLGFQFHRLGYVGYWPQSLTSGVDIFFVISGFIMWLTTANGMSPTEFFRRRIIRIVPLYWILTSVVLIVLIVFPSAVQSGRLETLHVLGSYLFFPVVHPTQGAILPLLIPGWTLNYEMFFYAIFALGLMLPPVSRLAVLSAILCGLAAIQLFTRVVPLTVEAFYTDSKIVEFVFGMVLGWLYVGGAKLPPAIACACLLLGTVMIAFTGEIYNPPSLVVGGAAFLVVAGAVMIERTSGVSKIGSLHMLGNASYSLYLSHPLVLSLVGQVWARSPVVGVPAASLAFGCVAIASALVTAVWIYLMVEMPLLQIGRLRLFGPGISRRPGLGRSPPTASS